MKLVYLSNSVFPSRSAESVYVMRMCEAFAELGWQVDLVVPDKTDLDQANVDDIFAFYGVESRFVIRRVLWPSCKKASRAWAWQAAQLAATIQPDLAYSRHLAAGLFAAEQGLPVIFEEHQCRWENRDWLHRCKIWIEDGIRSAGGVWQWARLYALPSTADRLSQVTSIRSTYHALMRHGGFVSSERILRRLATHSNVISVVTITHALKADIVAVFPRLACKIQVAPDGAPAPKSPLPKISFDSANHGAMNIGYCGHLYPGKGMEIIATLVQLCPWARFHIVGGLNEDIQRWRERLHGYENIVFYGHVEPNLTAAYIDHFDICLLPNQKSVKTFGNGDKTDIGKYTSPMKMFEYMAAGKPILASDITVLKEVLEHNYNSYLCPCDDAASWAVALREMADTPALRNRLGDQARTDLLTRYTWTARVQHILASISLEPAGDSVARPAAQPAAGEY